MKALLTLTTLALLSTSAFAASVQDFAGSFKLTSGTNNCYETLENTYLDESGCLVLTPKNADMDWSPTQKICNINKGVQTSKDEIPSIMYVGDITTTEYALLADTMITTDDTLYSFSGQQTVYNEGLTYLNSDEVYLTHIDENTLNLRHIEIGIESIGEEELKKDVAYRECTYQRN